MAIFGFLITIIVLLFIVLGVIFGLARGLYKSLIRVGVIVLSAVLAVVLALSCTSALLNTDIAGLPEWATGWLVTDGGIQDSTSLIQAISNYMQAEIDGLGDLAEVAPTLYAFIMVTPQVFVSELLFLVFFFIIKLILGIPEMILTMIFMKDVKKHRGFGALVGAVQGLFCACVVLVPILGIINLMGSAVDAVHTIPTEQRQTSADSVSIVETIDTFDNQFLAPVRGDFTYKTLKVLGIEHLCVNTFYTLSNATYEEQKICYFREVNDLIPALVSFVDLAEIDMENLTADDVEHLKTTVIALNRSHLISTTIAEITVNTSGKLLQGETVFGISINGEDGEENSFLMDILDTLANTEYEDIPADIPKIVDVLDVAVEYNILGAMDEEGDVDLLELLGNVDFTNDLLASLAHSNILSPMVISAANEYGIGQLTGMLNSPSNNAEAYDVMVNYVLDVFEELVSGNINYSDLDSDERDEYRHSIARVLVSFTKDLTEEDAYTAASIVLEQYAHNNIVPNIENVRATLQTCGIVKLSETGYVTSMVMQHDLLITDKYFFNKLTDEQKDAEAKHLAVAVVDVLALVDELGDNVENVDFSTLVPVGKMLNSMHAAQLLAPSLNNIIDLFLDTVYAIQLLPDNSVTVIRSKIDNGVLNYETLFKNISAAYTLANTLDLNKKNDAVPPSEPGGNTGNLPGGDTDTTPGGSETPEKPPVPPVMDEEQAEQLKQTVQDLYQSTDETTVEITQSIVTEQFLVDMGVPQQGAQTAQVVFNTFLEEVVNTKAENNDLDYKAESTAIESVMTIVANAATGNVTETISEDLINSVVASDTLTNTLISASKKEEAILADYFSEEMAENASAVLDDDQAKVEESISELENATSEDIEKAEKIYECLDALRDMIGLGANSGINPDDIPNFNFPA